MSEKIASVGLVCPDLVERELALVGQELFVDGDMRYRFSQPNPAMIASRLILAEEHVLSREQVEEMMSGKISGISRSFNAANSGIQKPLLFRPFKTLKISNGTVTSSFELIVEAGPNDPTAITPEPAGSPDPKNDKLGREMTMYGFSPRIYSPAEFRLLRELQQRQVGMTVEALSQVLFGNSERENVLITISLLQSLDSKKKKGLPELQKLGFMHGQFVWTKAQYQLRQEEFNQPHGESYS